MAAKNIYYSFLLKVVNILTSLLIVPITIHYVSAEQYGIWITLTSIVGWLSYFDIGFGNGFRFRFTEAKANNEYVLARQYVSTTYALLTLVFVGLGIVALGINHYINWADILHVNTQLYNILRITFALLICFFCIGFVLQIVTTLLIADQQPAKAAFIQTAGQVIALLVIFIMSHYTEGNLVKLVFIFSGIPVLITFVFSLFIFNSKTYRIYRPSLSFINFDLTKNIMNMGLKYFFTTCSLFVILQFIIIMISREYGPESVTEYNVAYKYYNALLMFFMIIITPFWSSFTDAYTQKDYKWMYNIIKRLEKAFLAFILLSLAMMAMAPYVFDIWVGSQVHISTWLSITTGSFIVSQMLTSLYIYPLNGTGKMKLQIIIDFCFAVVALPVLYYSCKWIGVPGMLLFLIVFHITLAAFCRKQLFLLISQKATGVWNQ